MTREVILDTETTGFDFAADRVVEIGALEYVDGRATGWTLHVYINPGQPMPAEALAVHGLTDEFLADKPPFAAVADELVEFLAGARVVAHNADFDIGMLAAELARLDRQPVWGEVVDTAALARRRHPGAAASLDALCVRYGVDNRHRIRHGALLDAELLAEVYIELQGGKQATLDLFAGPTAIATDLVAVEARPEALPSRLRPEDAPAHAALVATLTEPLWALYAKEAPDARI
jgi:DNA polymerase III subunit epsilon